MNILELKVRCNRKVWLAATLVLFIFLGRIQFLVLKGNLSLFDILSGVPRELVHMEWQDSGLYDILGFLLGVLIVIVITAFFIALAAGLGWVVSAVVSMMFSIARNVLNQTTSERNTNSP